MKITECSKINLVIKYDTKKSMSTKRKKKSEKEYKSVVYK